MGYISKLHEKTYQTLRSDFPNLSIRENIRPEWLLSSDLKRLEIDIYVEEIKTAVEIQGLQHYEFTPYFHENYQSFLDQKRRDKEKQDLCYGQGIRMVEISSTRELELFIDELKKDNIETKLEALKYYFEHERKMRPYRISKKTLLRRKKYRAWLKRSMRRKLIEQGIIKITPFPERQPGSHHQKWYARKILKCKQIGDGIWELWGGQSPHVVKRNGDLYHCDCEHNTATNKICCHIVKIYREYDILLNQFKIPEKEKSLKTSKKKKRHKEKRIYSP